MAHLDITIMITIESLFFFFFVNKSCMQMLNNPGDPDELSQVCSLSLFNLLSLWALEGNHGLAQAPCVPYF